jgi:hypothetical protein
MKKLLLAFATALLIPGMLGAATLGVLSDASSRMSGSPAPFSFSADPQEEGWGAIESLF